MTPRLHPYRLALAVWLLVGWSAAGAAAADPRAQIRGDIDGELRRQLEEAIGEVDGPPQNRFEARRRARGAVEAAQALLRSEGYYQATVDDVVEGEEAPVAIVEVTPGPRFLLTLPVVRWIAPEPDARAAAIAKAEIDLEPGAPGRAVDVIAGEGRVVAALSRLGYADARAEPRRVVVDHETFTVNPTYNIASGSLVRLNGIQLRSRGPTNPAWVAGLAPWDEGEAYDPEQVAELERRLLDTGVYDRVGVALAPADQTDARGLRPIIVTLQDRPRRIIEAGVTAATEQPTPRTTSASLTTAGGSGVDAITTWYNRFGRADTLRVDARLTDLNSRLGASLSLPHWRRPAQTLVLSAAAVNETTDAYDRTALVASADLRQRTGKTSWYTYGVGLDLGQYDERRFDPINLAPLNLTRDLAIVTARAGVYLDRSDDPLDPSSGWRLTASAQPTAVTGEDDILFLRTEAQGTAYLPLQQGRTILAGRLKLGSILGGGELSVPSDRLFYSGGGGSVRGYEYQGVAPRWPDGAPRGGLSLFETSLEVRRDIGENWGAVAFVDAGSVGFAEAPDFSNLRTSAGFGVRYQLPFGPIRADVAFPLDKFEGDADFQVYISIGQAF